MSRERSSDCSSKTLKLFASRLVQILVQARLGKSVGNNPCSSNEIEWFGLKIDELGEVTAQFRASLPEYPASGKSLSLNFYLYTSDAELLPVESWDLIVDDRKRVMNPTAYTDLSNLLRTVASVARVTPLGRHFVKKQSDETFVILYSISQETVSVDMGEDPKSQQISSFDCGIGRISLMLKFRTKVVLPAREIVPEPPQMRGKIVSSTGTEHSGSPSKSGSLEDSADVQTDSDDEEKEEKRLPLRFGNFTTEDHLGDFLRRIKESTPTLDMFAETESASSIKSQLDMLSSYESQFSSFVQSISDLSV